MANLIKTGNAVLKVGNSIFAQPAILSWGSVITSVAVSSPVCVKVTSDRIFTCSSSGLVSVFDLNTYSLITSFTVSGGRTLFCDQVNNILYVGGPTIKTYNLTTYALLQTINVAGYMGLAVQYATNRLWAVHSTINIIDIATNAVVNVISGGGAPYNTCNGIALDEDGDRCFVPAYSSGILKIVQISTGNITTTTAYGSYGPTGICISRSTNKIVLALGNGPNVLLLVDYVNPTAGSYATIAFGSKIPQAIDCNTTQLFVANFNNNTIDIFTNSFS